MQTISHSPTSRLNPAINDHTTALFFEGDLTICDLLTDDGTTLYGRLTIDQIKTKYPNKALQITSLEHAHNVVSKARAQAYTSPVILISQESYYERLEVLPPENFKSFGNHSGFRLSEYLTGTITEHIVHYHHPSNHLFYLSSNRPIQPGIAAYEAMIQEAIQNNLFTIHHS